MPHATQADLHPPALVADPSPAAAWLVWQIIAPFSWIRHA